MALQRWNKNPRGEELSRGRSVAGVEQCWPRDEEGAQEVGFTLRVEGLGLDQIDARETSKLRSGMPRFEKGMPSGTSLAATSRGTRRQRLSLRREGAPESPEVMLAGRGRDSEVERESGPRVTCLGYWVRK